METQVPLVAGVGDKHPTTVRTRLLLALIVLQSYVSLELVLDDKCFVTLCALERHDSRVGYGVGLAPVQAESGKGAICFRTAVHLECGEWVLAVCEAGRVTHVHHSSVQLLLTLAGEAFVTVVTLKVYGLPVNQGLVLAKCKQRLTCKRALLAAECG